MASQVSTKNSQHQRAHTPLVFPRWLQGLLLVLLAASLVLHYGITRTSMTSRALAKVTEPELAPALQALDSGKLETALSRLQFDHGGGLVIDPQTESALSVAANPLSDAADPALLNRVEFLIGKQFPAAEASQVTPLFRRYLHYRQQELANHKDRAPKNLEAEIRQFESLSRLQDRELGTELAGQLYGEHRRLARFMFAMRELEADTSLSGEEKQQRRQTLQQSLQAPLQESDNHETQRP